MQQAFFMVTEQLPDQGRVLVPGLTMGVLGQDYASFEIWGTVAVIYLIMTVTISQLVGYLERKYSIK